MDMTWANRSAGPFRLFEGSPRAGLAREAPQCGNAYELASGFVKVFASGVKLFFQKLKPRLLHVVHSEMCYFACLSARNT